MSKSKVWDTPLFKRILWASKPHRSLLIRGILLTVFLALLSPVRPFIIGKLVGDYVRLGDEKALLIGTIVVIGLLIIESVFLIVVSYTSSDLGQRVVKDLRDQLFKHITKLKLKYFDQNPIGKSSRSNPVTYIKAYDEIRKLFSSQRESKIRGYKPKHFSFNVDGGRCESCKGEGINTIEMQFMPDVNLTCENCNGTRFKKEILEININGKNISDILNLTVDDAINFFNELEEIKISEKLGVLQKVGLGYIKLGQSSSTLSGGEAQRVKLAYFLSVKTTSKNGLFLFDEPTTGLHFDDINKLLKSINQLIDKGNSVIIIEHNLEIIRKTCSGKIFVDAGIGTASDITKVFELGCSAVLLNTAVARARYPVKMATAVKHAAIAGRMAYLSGRMPAKNYAESASPLTGKAWT